MTLKKRLLSIALTLCMLVSLMPAVTLSARAAGESTSLSGLGTEDSPFLVATAADLAYMRTQVNSNGTIAPTGGGSAVTAKSAYYKQTADIVLGYWQDNDSDGMVGSDEIYDAASGGTVYTASNWIPIGRSDYSYRFTGTYDGDGKTVSGIFISASEDYQGLFGYVMGGTIKSLGVVDCYIAGGTYNYIGGVAGSNENSGTVANCYYDKQLCVSGGINGGDVTDSAEGRLTSVLTTDTAFSAGWTSGDTGTWKFTSGLYPRLTGYVDGSTDYAMDETYAAYVSSSPVSLASTSASDYETADAIISDFTISTANSVYWISDDTDIVSISGTGTSAVVNGTGSAALTAHRGSFSRTVTLTTFAPSSVLPTDGSFTDTDSANKGKIAGTITWTAASPTTGIDGYKIYWGSDASTKLTGYADAVYTVSGAASEAQTVAANTALPSGAKYFLIYNYSAYGNSKSCLAVSIADLPAGNTAPAASSVAVSGTAKVGKTLAGSYAYSDADGDSEIGTTYKWYRATDSSGTGAAAISGAGSKTYVLTSDDIGAYVCFEVIPSDGTDSGTAVKSAYTAVVTDSSGDSENYYVITKGADTAEVAEGRYHVYKQTGSTGGFAAFTASADVSGTAYSTIDKAVKAVAADVDSDSGSATLRFGLTGTDSGAAGTLDVGDENIELGTSGTYTLKGNLTNSANNYLININGASVIVDGAYFQNTDDGSVLSNEGSGDITVSGGVLENNGTGKAIGCHGSGKITVNGGKVYSVKDYTIYNAGAGDVTISGSEWDEATGTGTLIKVINGGAISTQAGLLNINGGTIIGKNFAVSANNGGAYIRDGRIEPSEGTAVSLLGGTSHIIGGTITSTNTAEASSLADGLFPGVVFISDMGHANTELYISGGTITNTASGCPAIFNYSTSELAPEYSTCTSNLYLSRKPAISGTTDIWTSSTIHANDGTDSYTGNALEIQYGSAIKSGTTAAVSDVTAGINDSLFDITNPGCYLSLDGGDLKIYVITDKWLDNTNYYSTGWYTANPNATSFTISTAADLAGLAYLVNNGTDLFSGNTITLANNINIGAHKWVPIGDYSSDYPFCGTFDGNDKTISGLFINESDSNKQGLFGYVEKGDVKDLTVFGTVTGDEDIGGIVGYIKYGVIENCIANCSVIGSYNTGSIAGRIKYSTTENCCSSGSVTDSEESAGGIVGYIDSDSVVDGCISSGTVNASDSCSNIGGVAGFIDNDSVIRNCVSSCSVTVSETCSNTGGIAGFVQSDAALINCCSSGTVSGGSKIGGIAGTVYTDGSVENCYNRGNVSGADNAGAIVGYVYGETVRYSYWLSTAEVCSGLSATGTGSCTGCGSFATAGGLISLVETVDNTYVTSTSVTLLGALEAWVENTNLADYDTWVSDSESGFPRFSEAWVPETFTFSYFGSNGESLLSNSSAILRQSDMLLSNFEPAASGKDFLGWATSPGSSTVSYLPGDDYKPDYDAAEPKPDEFSLYAVWQDGAIVNSSSNRLFNSGRFDAEPYIYSDSEISSQAPGTTDNGGYDIHIEGDEDGTACPYGSPQNVGVSFTMGTGEGQIVPPSGSAQIVVYGYDVDAPGETDSVYLIDETLSKSYHLGQLSGMNDEWNTTILSVPQSLLQSGHTYHIKLTIDENYSFSLRSLYLLLDGGEDAANITAKSVLLAYDSGSLSAVTSLTLSAASTYSLEYKFSRLDESGNTIQLGSAAGSITTVAAGETAFDTKSVSVELTSGNTYRVDVTIKKNAVPVAAITKSFTYYIYTYTYNLNGKPGTAPEGGTVLSGEKLTMPAEPTSSGYTFGGWYTDSACTSAYDFTALVTGNVTLYAKWTAEDSGGGNGGSSTPSRTITVTETNSSLFTGREGQIKAEANMSNAFSNSVEVKVTDTKQDASGFGLGAGNEVYPFDISLYIKGTNTKTKPKDGYAVTISLPVPDKLLHAKEQLAIVHKSDAGVVTTLESKLKQINGVWYLVFEATEFSPYALVVSNTGTNDETIGLPYYSDSNGKEVFIGFAANGKYIAPSGVTVLFKKNPKSFTDAESHWAKDYIGFVAERELFTGTGENKFEPDAGMTRAMFATVIGRLYERSYGEITAASNGTFTDVDYDGWYGKYVDWAADNSIITGVGGGLFAPDREITRQEMAAILYRFANFLGILPGDTDTALTYPDAGTISGWAQNAALYCRSTGIITGRDGGNFAPQGTATRAEVAAILKRFIKTTVN